MIGTAGAKSGSRTCYAAQVLIIFYAVKNGQHQTMDDSQQVQPVRARSRNVTDVWVKM